MQRADSHIKNYHCGREWRQVSEGKLKWLAKQNQTSWKIQDIAMTIQTAPTFSFCVFQPFPTQTIINLMGKEKEISLYVFQF